MVKATKCERCKNYIILNFKKEAQDAVCPYCDKLFRYRLIGASICEIDLMNLTFGEAEVCDGTGL